MFRALPSALLVTFVVVGCVGEDPEPTSSSSSSSSSSSGGTGARSISCDATSTCTGTDRCCGVGTDWIGSSCKADCGGAYTLTCDDAKDCDAGQVCCYKTDGGARAVASYCATECRSDKLEKQLCAIGGAGECKTGSCTPLVQFAPSGLARCE